MVFGFYLMIKNISVTVILIVTMIIRFLSLYGSLVLLYAKGWSLRLVATSGFNNGVTRKF